MAIEKGQVFGDTLQVLFSTEGQIYDSSHLSSELPLLKIHQEGTGLVTSDLNYPSVALSWSERVNGSRMRLDTPGGDTTLSLPDDTGSFAKYTMIFWDALEESV